MAGSIRRRKRRVNHAMAADVRLSSHGRKAHTGFEPVSAETEVPEPLRRKLEELRAQSKKQADERR